ncbi:histidine kinase [Nonomuraea jabiensis]|uniref:histidine kinase n=1 Tax=Nonomuraea jabiensis TaxID=882448 RepID=UPI003F4DA88C
MQVTPPLPLLRRVPSGFWTALAWSVGLALTFLMRVRLPGEAEPAYSPGALLYHWDGLSFLIVATALVVAGSILLDRRPLPALTLLLAASAVACMPLGVGEIPSAQFLAVDAALYFIAATAPRRTSIAAIAMSLITLAGYLGARLLFGWVVGTSAELAVAMTAVIAWLVGRSVHQAHVHAESQRVHAESQRVQATAQAIIGERLRIARELHDMVAHSIGIIALQAGAARRVIDTQPVRAREALGEIETVGRETLSGLRRMLGALRHPEPTHPRETTPITHPKPAHPPQSESSDRSAPVDQQPGALPNPAQLSQSESSGRSMLVDQDPGALPAPAQLSQSESSGRSMLVDQQLGALLDRPAPTAQRPDALLGQYASVEPSQRTWSDCPESGQEPVAVPLGPPESGPTPSTAPLDPSLAPLDAGLAPAGLADLERLAATTTAAGVQVEVRWRGVRRPLPPEIDMSAYRIVQEAVTNVTRHAEHPSCQVTIDFGDEELAIEVIDPAPSPQPSLPPDPSSDLSSGRSTGFASGRSTGLSAGCGSGFSPDHSPDLSSGRSTGLASGRSTGLSPDCGSGLSADSGSGFSLGPGSGLASGRSPGFSSGLGSGLGSGHSPGLFSDSGSGPSLDASRAAAPALDINPAADRSPRFGPSPDASLSLDAGPGLGDVPAHSSGSGAGRGFGFGGGRGPGRGRKARGGYGLVGMRERVALLHGVFSAGPRQEGGFRVVARLPVPARVR